MIWDLLLVCLGIAIGKELLPQSVLASSVYLRVRTWVVGLFRR